MKKVLRVVAIASIVISSLGIAMYETFTIGTVTGLTFLPTLGAICWFGVVTVVKDMLKDSKAIYKREYEDEDEQA